MTAKRFVQWAGAAVGVGACAYGTYVGLTWRRYGHPRASVEADPLLDEFMPVYEVVERHRVRVSAPADITFSASCDQGLMQPGITRTIFKARELILGGEPEKKRLPQGLLAEVKEMGWGVLAEIPGKEIVVGAVTQPWKADVVFRALPPEEFAAFEEPDYVKIVWTLRADPIGGSESVFFTETRAVTTDAQARRKFRLYWSFFSPGIALIRRLSLGPLKREAERRSRMAA